MHEQFGRGGPIFKKFQNRFAGSPLSPFFVGPCLGWCACDYPRSGPSPYGTYFPKDEIGGFAFGARRKAGAAEAFANGHPAYSGEIKRWLECKA